MQHFVIDGYNVLHAIPSLKKLLAHDATSARERLIHYIAQLTHNRKFRCTIVFDGSQPNTPKNAVHAPIHVVYSSPLSADTKIKEIIEKTKNRSLLTIVSSDHEILNFARVCSCETYTSQRFTSQLFNETAIIDEKPDITLTKHQINEWLKIFDENK